MAERYFTDSVTHFEIGDYWLEEAMGLEYTWQLTKTPLYGFRDIFYRTTSIGRSLVTGSLWIHFVRPGYLYEFLLAKHSDKINLVSKMDRRERVKDVLNSWQNDVFIVGDTRRVLFADAFSFQFEVQLFPVTDGEGQPVLPADYLKNIPREGQFKVKTAGLGTFGKIFNYSFVGAPKIQTLPNDPVTGSTNRLYIIFLKVVAANTPALSSTAGTNPLADVLQLAIDIDARFPPSVEPRLTVEFLQAPSVSTGPGALAQLLTDQLAQSNVQSQTRKEGGADLMDPRDARVRYENTFELFSNSAKEQYWPDFEDPSIPGITGDSAVSESAWVDSLSGIDISIVYRDRFVKRLKNVFFASESQRVMAEVPDSGRCILEQYTFIASHIEGGAAQPAEITSSAS